MYTKMYVNSQQDRRIRPKFRILYAKKDTGLKKAHHFRCWECWLISDMQLSFISHNLTLRKSHMVAGQNLFPRSISAKSDFQRKLNCWLSRPRPAPLHYGIRADILKKAIRKCLTLKIDFSANFNLTHDFFWAEALSTPQKLENAKMNLQISI